MASGQWAWHIHHGTLVEQLGGADGLAERQNYIRIEKPYKERARRLRLMKVVENQALIIRFQESLVMARSLPADLKKKMRIGIQRAISALHAHECKRCPWNGKTIFPKANASKA